jgi:hypothetical protein
MSENLRKLFHPQIETIDGAERHALRLFLEIERHHGEAEARRIFTERGREPAKTEIAEWKIFQLLDRYDNMKPEPNVMELARQLDCESRTLPPEEQLLPRGGTTVSTIDHYIREQIRRRKAKITDGTWDGPPWKWNDSQRVPGPAPAEQLRETAIAIARLKHPLK